VCPLGRRTKCAQASGVDNKPEKLEEERHQTDESLQAERSHADALLTAKLAEAESETDRGVEEAREEANAATDEARREADRVARTVETAAAATRVVQTERAKQDAAREEERKVTDEVLREDRKAHARVLAELRPLARESTDRNLLIERDRSDEAVDNRDHFLGIVSHDLRNLLGGIVFAASTLPDEAKRETASAAADRIRRYAAHMDRLIGDLLDVSSIEAGRLAISVRPGFLRDVIIESIDALEPFADPRGITIQNVSSRSPMPAMFDHDRMVQVVTNLLSNAVKFSPDGGVVTVRALDDGELITVAVEDRGVGIPEGMKEAVFERFWQAPGNAGRGTGLGLYISRHLVTAHGGRIWAEPRARGGTRFLFAFPSDLAPPGKPHTSH